MKKKNISKSLAVWQHASAQTAAMATGLFYPSGGTCIVDADPYDCVLRTNAGRLANYAGGIMGTERFPHFAPTLMREAALLLDLLYERQHAREEARENRKARSHG
jgi:hypothetical protein